MIRDVGVLRAHEARVGIDAGVESAERSLRALRNAARDRTHFAHLPTFRAAFARGILARRDYLRRARPAGNAA